MTGDEMQLIRASLGLSRYQLGRAIGYTGNENTIFQRIKRFESGEDEIPAWIATCVRALDRDGLLMFVSKCQGMNDPAEFVRLLTQHLTGAADVSDR